ncbi:MAG: hypothetical protein IJW66_03340 [Clostridia bacterium]|nr:hypothetical protein [Clostridia bacterium]
MLFFKRLAFLIFILTYISALLISCANAAGGNSVGGDGAGEAAPPSLDGLIPETVKFSDIAYERPDTVTLCSKISEATRAVLAGDANHSEIKGILNGVEALYSNYLSMLSYAEIMRSKNVKDHTFAEEYRALKDAHADILVARERLAFAVATSDYEDADNTLADTTAFRIKSPTVPTDALFTLIKQEEELKQDFTLLSEDTVYITYGGITDTFRGTLNRLKESLGDGAQLVHASDECHALYRRARTEAECEIFTELVRVRTLIADTLGYDSYNDYSYEIYGYAHTFDGLEKYAEDIFDYLLPVYTDLNHKIFNPYFNNHIPKLLDKSTVINNMLTLYKSVDSSIYNTLGSMLSAGLYDIAPEGAGRSGDTFIAYFDAMSVPFLFHTTAGDARDYSSLAYEFGKYYDVLVNKHSSFTPIDAEISARTLEMITLSRLSEAFSREDGKYIYYLHTRNAMKALITNSLVTLVEHEIYGLSPAEVDEEAINSIINGIASEHSLRAMGIADIINDELVLKPHSAESKAISVFYATKILFDEQDRSEQIKIYKALLGRAEGVAPESVLSGFGISSPFDDGEVAELADDIFYSINGYHYYKQESTPENAA